jgi:ribosomal protein L35AE/L33A
MIQSVNWEQSNTSTLQPPKVGAITIVNSTPSMDAQIYVGVRTYYSENVTGTVSTWFGNWYNCETERDACYQ